MAEFKVPDELTDLELPRPDRITVAPGGAILRDETTAALHNLLDSALNQLVAGDSGALAEAPGCFDCFYGFVKDIKHLPSEIKTRLLDVLQHTTTRLTHELGGSGAAAKKASRAAAAAGQAPLGLRNSFKMAVFLLFSAAWQAESVHSSDKQNELLQPKAAKEKPAGTAAQRKKAAAAAAKADGKFNWETTREEVLSTMAVALTADLQRLWNVGVPDEAFASLFARLAYKMLELPSTVRSKPTRAAALTLIAVPYHAVSALGSSVGAAVLQLITDYEHLTTPMAELCGQLALQYSDTRLASELLREIGRMNVAEAARNAAGLRNTAAFMTEVCALLPGVAHANTAVLLPHLGSEPYTLRSAVATCLASVVGAACEEDLRRKRAAEGMQSEADAQEDSEEVRRETGRLVHMEPAARDALLDVLEERVLDSSSYTRAATLRAWCSLCERGCLPHARIQAAAAIAAGRLKDKSAIARRAAVQLLCALLERNPYTGSLDPQPYTDRAQVLEEQLAALPVPAGPQLSPEEAAALAEHEATHSSNSNSTTDTADADPSDNSDGAEATADTPAKHTDEQSESGEVTDISSAEDVSQQELSEEQQAEQAALIAAAEARAVLMRELTYCRGALAFIQVYEGPAAEQMGCMLQSRSVSDVVEALRFFVKARAFALPCAAAGVRKGLSLVWHAEASVRDEVTKAFVEVFITTATNASVGSEILHGNNNSSSDSDYDAAAQRVAHNMVLLVAQSSLAELASLEEVVTGLVKNGVLEAAVFDQLWSAAAAQGQADWARAAALQALALGTAALPELAEDSDRLQLIASIALGKSTQEGRDWATVKAACTLLQKCPPSHTGDRALALEASIRLLTQFLQGDWCRDPPAQCTQAATEVIALKSDEADMQHWFGAAEAALGVLFRHSPTPELLCAQILHNMAEHIFSETATQASPLALARLCFVLGHTALKLLVYSEDLASRLKRTKGSGAPASKTVTAAAPTKAAATAKKPTKKTTKKSAKRAENSDSEGETEAPQQPEPSAVNVVAVAAAAVDDTMEQELGMTAEDEAEDEKRFSELAEREIVGRNLLGVFGPLLARIVANEGGAFSHPLLRESAVLALSKYMCISGDVCARHLDLLFTALAAAPETAVRANIVVALGDLAFRFPNAVEPWNAEIYARLRDPSPRVRANTLMVLTHLILNDMVKVKGLVSDIALCLRDPLPRLRDMAKLFFNELAKRGDNPIYNLLPDIIGRLSQAEDVSAEAFQETLTFLLSFIKKDKQVEGLLDKLVSRIIAASDAPQQRRDMAYCLGQLQVTEKSIKKLSETVATYKDALGDEEVFSHFMALAGRARKFAKPEVKAAVDEWEKQLLELHTGGADNEGAAARASKASKRAKKAPRKTAAALATHEEGVDENNEAPTPARPTRGAKTAAATTTKAAASASKARKPAAAAAAAKKAPAGKKPAAAAKSKRRVVESSSNEGAQESSSDDNSDAADSDNDSDAGGKENSRSSKSTSNSTAAAAVTKGSTRARAPRRQALREST